MVDKPDNKNTSGNVFDGNHPEQALEALEILWKFVEKVESAKNDSTSKSER